MRSAASRAHVLGAELVQVMATAHCSRCGLEVELDVLANVVPEVILCADCKVEHAPSTKGCGEPELSIEIVEAGTDELVLGLDGTF